VQWGKRSTLMLGQVAVRRVTNLEMFAVRIAEFAGREAEAAISALVHGSLFQHLDERVTTAASISIETAQNLTSAIKSFGARVTTDPAKHGPELLALVLGFYAGSGGLDGNGGVPDLDIALFGIGDHRSIFTHSIIAGALIESAVFSLADLTDTIYTNLPSLHDPLWDTLKAAKETIAVSLVSGTSAGIGYHLMVDATIQPAPYKDLPFELPLEAHQAIFALNSMAELADIRNKGASRNEINRLIFEQVEFKNNDANADAPRSKELFNATKYMLKDFGGK
jgi:hypothetical protein